MRCVIVDTRIKCHSWQRFLPSPIVKLKFWLGSGCEAHCISYVTKANFFCRHGWRKFWKVCSVKQQRGNNFQGFQVSKLWQCKEILLMTNWRCNTICFSNYTWGDLTGNVSFTQWFLSLVVSNLFSERKRPRYRFTISINLSMWYKQPLYFGLITSGSDFDKANKNR